MKEQLLNTMVYSSICVELTVISRLLNAMLLRVDIRDFNTFSCCEIFHGKDISIAILFQVYEFRLLVIFFHMRHEFVVFVANGVANLRYLGISVA